MRFLLEGLLSSYWAVQDFFYVSLRDSSTVFLAIVPYIVLQLSNVSVQKLKLRMKRIFLILIIRYNFEISEDDHPHSISQMLTLKFANARLLTLAPDSRPERRFALLTREQEIYVPIYLVYFFTVWHI